MLFVFLGKNGSYISLSETSTVNTMLFYFLYLQINYQFRTIKSLLMKTTSFCNIKPFGTKWMTPSKALAKSVPLTSWKN